jgi:anti-sigma28 factor (negative regulator of flagellin synthesis)
MPAESTAPANSAPATNEQIQEAVATPWFESLKIGKRPSTERPTEADAANAEAKAQQEAAEKAAAEAASAKPADVHSEEIKRLLAERDARIAKAEADAEAAKAGITERDAKIADYARYDPVVKQLQEAGFNTGQAVQEALTQQNEKTTFEAKMSQANQELVAELQPLINSGELPLDTAEKILQSRLQERARLVNLEIATDRNKRMTEASAQQNAQTQAQRELAAAAEQFPLLAFGRAADGKGLGYGEALVQSLHAAGNGPIDKLAAYVNDYITKTQEQAVADHIAKQTQIAALPVPVNAGGGAPPATEGPKGGLMEQMKSGWADLLGIKVGS